MANEIIAAVLGAVIGVGGALFGVRSGAKLSRRAGQELLVQQAKAEFISAFIETLVKLNSEVESPGECRAQNILQGNYPTHFAAYLKLRAVCLKDQQASIEVAWRNYTGDHQYKYSEEAKFYRFSHVADPNNEEHQHMIAIKHVNNLLKSINT